MQLYFGAKVFEKADKLVDKFRAKAESLADEVEPTEFRELLYYLVDTVLEKGELPQQRRHATRGAGTLMAMPDREGYRPTSLQKPTGQSSPTVRL